jgi:hypothetical protein
MVRVQLEVIAAIELVVLRSVGQIAQVASVVLIVDVAGLDAPVVVDIAAAVELGDDLLVVQ